LRALCLSASAIERSGLLARRAMSRGASRTDCRRGRAAGVRELKMRKTVLVTSEPALQAAEVGMVVTTKGGAELDYR